MNFQPLKMLSPLLRMHAFTIWAWFYLKAFTLTVPSAPYSGLTLSPPPGLTIIPFSFLMHQDFLFYFNNFF